MGLNKHFFLTMSYPVNVLEQLTTTASRYCVKATLPGAVDFDDFDIIADCTTNPEDLCSNDCQFSAQLIVEPYSNPDSFLKEVYVPQKGDIFTPYNGECTIRRPKAVALSSYPLGQGQGSEEPTNCYMYTASELRDIINKFPNYAGTEIHEVVIGGPYSEEVYPVPEWKNDLFDEVFVQLPASLSQTIANNIPYQNRNQSGTQGSFFCSAFEGINYPIVVSDNICRYFRENETDTCTDVGITNFQQCALAVYYFGPNRDFFRDLTSEAESWSPRTIGNVFSWDGPNNACVIGQIDGPPSYVEGVTTCVFSKVSFDAFPNPSGAPGPVEPYFVPFPNSVGTNKTITDIISTVQDIPIAKPKLPAGIPISKLFQPNQLIGLFNPPGETAGESVICKADFLGIFSACRN